MRTYDVIFFDLDHTLVDTRQQYLSGLAMALQRQYGEDVPDDFIMRFMRHNDALWPQYDQRSLSMQELRRRRFLYTWRDFGVERTVAEADEFHTLYSETLEFTLVCFPGTLDLLSELVQTHQLGIITNGSPDMQEKKLAVTGLLPYFPANRVIVSEAVGLAKPHPMVYERACLQFAVDPNLALMVGDNYQNDVLGARAAGLHALWYGPDAVTTPALHRDEVLDSHQETALERPLRQAADVLQFIRFGV